jgi:hypothetical protein
MAYIGVSPSNGVRKKHTYTATASQTSFSGAGDEGITLAYRDSNYVDVYQNGVKLADEDYTATSGTAIVLAQGASADDIVEIIAFDVFSVADTVSKADGGTFDGNVAMAGTLGLTGVLTANGGAVFNEGGADVDFRVESDTVDHALFVDGATGKIGIGIVPISKLHIKVSDNAYTGGIQIEDTDSTTKSAITHVNGGLYISSNATNDHIGIDATGAVTMPLQPAFSVHKNGTNQNNITANDTFYTITWSTERFDQNADFASNTFTAPVTGKYFLQLHVRLNDIDSAAGYYIISINTTLKNYRFIFDPDFVADPTYWSITMSVLADMDANDTVTVSILQQTGTAQTDIDGNAEYTFFTGYLVA